MLNGWPDNMKPSFRTEATQFKDPEQISRVMADLASAGSVMAIDDPADADIRKLIGVSVRPELSVGDLALMGTLPFPQQPDGSGRGKPTGGKTEADAETNMGNNDE